MLATLCIKGLIEFNPYFGGTVGEGTLSKLGIQLWDLKKFLVKKVQSSSKAEAICRRVGSV